MLIENVANADWDVIRLTASSICSSLAHMHDNKFIHGDVKPKNVSK